MLVKDLIEKLKDLPEDYCILMESGWAHYEIDIHELDEDKEIIFVPLLKD